MTDQQFQDEQTRALALLPPEFHSAVAYHAWEQGHAYGYDEVLIHARNLADALLQPCRNYADRLGRQSLEQNRQFS